MILWEQETTLVQTVVGQLPSFFGGLAVAYITVVYAERHKKKLEKKERDEKHATELEISKAKHDADREASAQAKLNCFADEAIAEAKILREIREKSILEKMQLEHKIFLLEQEIKELKRFSDEQNDEIIFKQSEIEKYQRQLEDIKRQFEAYRYQNGQ